MSNRLLLVENGVTADEEARGGDMHELPFSSGGDELCAPSKEGLAAGGSCEQSGDQMSLLETEIASVARASQGSCAPQKSDAEAAGAFAKLLWATAIANAYLKRIKAVLSSEEKACLGCLSADC